MTTLHSCVQGFEVTGEMVREDFRVGVGIGVKTASDTRAQFAVGEDAAESAVQDLSAGSSETFADGDIFPEFEVVPFELVDVSHVALRRSRVERGGDVIGCLVTVVTSAGEIDDLPEKWLIVPGDDAQSFEVTGACGLHVKSTLRRSRECRVH